MTRDTWIRSDLSLFNSGLLSAVLVLFTVSPCLAAGEHFVEQSPYFNSGTLKSVGIVTNGDGKECLGLRLFGDVVLTAHDCAAKIWSDSNADTASDVRLGFRSLDGNKRHKYGSRLGVEWGRAWQSEVSTNLGTRIWAVLQLREQRWEANPMRYFMGDDVNARKRSEVYANHITLVGISSRFKGGKFPAAQTDCSLDFVSWYTYTTNCVGYYDRPGVLVLAQSTDETGANVAVLMGFAHAVSTQDEIKKSKRVTLEIAGPEIFMETMNRAYDGFDDRKAQYLALIEGNGEAEAVSPPPKGGGIIDTVGTILTAADQQLAQQDAEAARRRAERQQEADAAREKQLEEIQQQVQPVQTQQLQPQKQQPQRQQPQTTQGAQGPRVEPEAVTQCATIEENKSRGGHADLVNLCSFPILVAWCSLGGDFDCGQPHFYPQAGITGYTNDGGETGPGRIMISSGGNSYGGGFVWFACRADSADLAVLTSINPVQGVCLPKEY